MKKPKKTQNVTSNIYIVELTKWQGSFLAYFKGFLNYSKSRDELDRRYNVTFHVFFGFFKINILRSRILGGTKY